MGKLFLISGDIIENSKGMDAVVNAQNKYMDYGGGICGAIYRAAGADLLDYCKKTYSTNMETGEVRITSGFNLNMDIIHILAPVSYEEKDPINKLMESYDNLLESILDNHYQKVIMPSIGTGTFAYNHEDIAQPLMEKLNNFCTNNNVAIYFINRYPLYTNIYLKELINIKNIDLKNDLIKCDNIKKYLEDNNLINLNSKALYKEFLENKDLPNMCLADKLIALQYVIENFDVTTEQIKIIVDSI